MGGRDEDLTNFPSQYGVRLSSMVLLASIFNRPRNLQRAMRRLCTDKSINRVFPVLRPIVCKGPSTTGWVSAQRGTRAYRFSTSSATEASRTSMRTHTCGELTEREEGERVVLVGWLQSFRKIKGGLAFATLRDAYGETQIMKPSEVQLFDDANDHRSPNDGREANVSVNSIPLESVVCVEGVVQTRPASQVKKNKPTGTIEVIAENIKTLNKADWEDIPLVQKQHFNPNSPPATEALRLKYRHLDLRRPLMQRNLRLRASVTSAARSALESFGFVDVETPLLFKSTPEGAREFLVPTRTPERFWALPQSPQQYKQLLMVAGLDRYYQIARCFRDESGRADDNQNSHN